MDRAQGRRFDEAVLRRFPVVACREEVSEGHPWVFVQALILTA